MAQLVKKENITIVTGTYSDQQGNEKKRYKTIAELITMRGDDGSEYQFGEMWGPHGVTKFNVYAQDDNSNQNNSQGQNNNNNNNQNQGQQSGGYAQGPQNGGFGNQNQGQQNNGHNNGQ